MTPYIASSVKFNVGCLGSLFLELRGQSHHGNISNSANGQENKLNEFTQEIYSRRD